MNNYIKWEDKNGNIFFQVLNESDEEVASVEKELLEKGYLIYGVGYWSKQGNQYPTIFAKKIREGIEK